MCTKGRSIRTSHAHERARASHAGRRRAEAGADKRRKGRERSMGLQRRANLWLNWRGRATTRGTRCGACVPPRAGRACAGGRDAHSFGGRPPCPPMGRNGPSGQRIGRSPDSAMSAVGGGVRRRGSTWCGSRSRCSRGWATSPGSPAAHAAGGSCPDCGPRMEGARRVILAMVRWMAGARCGSDGGAER